MYPHALARLGWRGRTGITLASAVAALGLACAASAATLSPSGSVTFAAPITQLHASLPLYQLGRSAAPSSFVAGVLRSRGLQPLAEESRRLVSRNKDGVANAFVDPVTGNTEVYPEFISSGSVRSAGTPAQIAGATFARRDIIPADATSIRLGDITPVFDAVAAHGSDGQSHAKVAPQVLFTYVSALRYASGLQVFGKGSHATVAVGNDGSIRGFVRRWQPAQRAGMVVPTASATQVERDIVTQLIPVAAGARVTVQSVKPAYYDGGKYLQPVYAFFATIQPIGAKTPSEAIRGFVPVGRLVEPIPVIGQRSTERQPMAPPQHGIGPQFNVSNISLGEYANDDGSMLDMANAYYNGFDSVPAWWYGPPIARTQYYWASSGMYLAYANSYVNAVQVAYTQPHGDWWVNTTNGRGGDPFYIYQIGVSGRPGYGAASGGQLATWIIDSCEVIPSYYDLQYTTGNGYTAFNYWWPVFQGLHRALGFRTQMLLGEDTMNYDIAQSMALGANANSAFYNEVAAFSFPTYVDTHLNLTVHYDRVSEMYDTRNANESIYSVQGQSASGQLHNSWMNN